MSVTIHEGSILDCKTDAIVNPANGHLNHGGGLARIIDCAAQSMSITLPSPHSKGPETRIPGPIAPETTHPELKAIHEWREDHANAPLIATGDAYATRPGMLPFTAVIHAVGPIWGGGGFHEPKLLSRAHSSSIVRAEELGCKTLAIPAISCGIFGYPVEKAAPVAVGTALTFGRVFGIDVTFALFEDAHVAAYTKALDSARPSK